MINNSSSTKVKDTCFSYLRLPSFILHSDNQYEVFYVAIEGFKQGG